VKSLGVILLLVAGVAAIPLRQTPPVPIRYGQTVEGELNDIQQAVQYVFDAGAGDNVTIQMQPISGDLAGRLSLATFAGDTVALGQPNGTDIVLQTTVETAGAYVITAGRSGGAGSFSLSLSLGQPAIPEVLESGARLQPIVRGTPVQGALTPEAAFSLFWFEGQASETITLTSAPGFQPLLVLYDANFTELTRNAATLTAPLPTSNLYFVAAALPVNNPGGNFSITLSGGGGSVAAAPPRDVQPGQSSISYGESVRGTVSGTATAFTFQFTGAQGDEITVSMTRAGGDLDSYLYLLDPGGVTLAEDDNSGGNSDARLTATLPGNGSYLILATRLGQESGTTAGNFLLTLSSPNEAIASAPPAVSTAGGNLPPGLENLPQIALGQTVTGQITGQTFITPYLFSGVAGDEVVIDMTSADGLDSMVLLLKANQEPVAENDDIEGAPDTLKDSELTYTIEETGYYIIVATRFEGEIGTSEGTYELSVNRSGQEAEAPLLEAGENSSFIRRLNAERIRPGATPVGAFDPLRFARVYAFGVGSEAIIDFTVNTDNNIASTVILTDDNLQPLATTDGGTLLGVEIPAGNYLFFVAPADGPAEPVEENYILAFSATGEGLVFEEATPDADSTQSTQTAVETTPIPITYGDAVSGTIDDDNPEQDYIFSAVADDTVRIQMTAPAASELDSFVQLVDIEGTVIAENDDIVPGQNRNSSLQVTLPADGEYTIRATRYTGDTAPPDSAGAYDLTLEFVDPALVGVNQTILPIQDGETISNSVSEEQYLMFYSFTANSGDVVTIDVNTASGDLDAVLYLYTYTSGGQPVEIMRNDDSARGGTFDPLIEDFSIPRSGTYLIAVGRFPEGTSSGEFTMSLSIEPPSAEGPPAEEVATEAP
jgi:hypothetical protein